jgi:hypothetical protein
MSRGTASTRAFRALLVAACLIAHHPFTRADDRPAALPSAEQSERQPENRAPRIKILVSKETTHVLQPLDKDGWVDYHAALSRLVSQGITAENNAAIPFVQAFGASDLKGAYRERFFQLLGIKPLPEQGDYFKELRPLSEREQADFDRAQIEPWKARDFPLFNEWLKSNERPLSLVVAGTRRLRYYNPWALRPAVPLMFALLPTEQASRTWARSLVLRAMLRLNEGNIAGAEEDLIACHRLGRLIGMSPCLIGALVSYAIETLAFQGDAALMEHGKLNARDALAYQARLRTLPPLPVIVDVFDRYERLSYLDTIKAFIRDPQYRPEAVAALAHSSDSRLISDRLSAFWNEVFRVSNKVCDKWAAAAGLPATERQKAFDTLGEQMKRDAAEVIGKDLFDKFMAAEGPDQMKMIAEKFHGMVQEFAADPTRASKLPGSIFRTTTPAECGRQMGKVLVCLLLPAINASCAAEDRARARGILEQVGFALVAYRADHGSFPVRLKMLVPKYIASVPTDPCTVEPLRYEWRVDRFLLFSRGTNGVDEDGRSFDDKPPGDDIGLQIPRKPRIEPLRPRQNAER